MEEELHPQFHSLFQDFYNITGIRTGICDFSYHPLTNVHALDLCHHFHEEAPETHEMCVRCDKWAMKKCQETKKGFLFRCPLGLLEYGTPLYAGDSIIGYASTGMITDGSEEEIQAVTDRINEFGLDKEKFMGYYNEAIHRSPAEIQSVCSVFETCVSHIYYKNAIRLKEVGLIKEIDDYIAGNLKADLSVPALCDHFNISKAELYDIIKGRANTGVAEYIKSVRLRTAEKMLINSNLPITYIADYVGLDNYSYFTKIFKSEYGSTPRDYRNTHSAEVFINNGQTFDILTPSNDSIPVYNCFN